MEGGLDSSRRIDLTDLLVERGIAVNSYIEILYLSLYLENKRKYIPVFPNEIRTGVLYDLSPLLQKLMQTDKENFYELINNFYAFISAYNIMPDIGGDLAIALHKYGESDWEGSIKFFRKVVEALRQDSTFKSLEIELENRKDLLKKLLNKTYALLSNFGEHAGTRGRKPEAELAKELAVALVQYIAEYSKKQA